MLVLQISKQTICLEKPEILLPLQILVGYIAYTIIERTMLDYRIKTDHQGYVKHQFSYTLCTKSFETLYFYINPEQNRH